MITSIKIQGYKSVKEQEVSIKKGTNILIGSNGVGKSNFLSIFPLLRSVFTNGLKEYVETKGGADSLLHFGKKITSEIDITIHFENAVSYGVKLGIAQDSLTKKVESTSHWQNDKTTNIGVKIEEQFEVYHFHDTSETSSMKSKCNIDDNRKLKPDGSNIAAYLYYLKSVHPKHFKRIELTIQSIAPFFDHFVLEPSRLNNNVIQLEWREKGFPDAYFNAYNLSDGTLRFICLATLLMQPEPPKTIIIDEPELGLHPVAINKLASLIRKTSNKVQMIVSTQSINLIDNFEPEDIIVADRKDKSSTFRRLTSEELSDWVEEYTLGDMWGKNLFGAQPYSI
jgi:predicted ATPase